MPANPHATVTAKGAQSAGMTLDEAEQIAREILAETRTSYQGCPENQNCQYDSVTATCSLGYERCPYGPALPTRRAATVLAERLTVARAMDAAAPMLARDVQDVVAREVREAMARWTGRRA